MNMKIYTLLVDEKAANKIEVVWKYETPITKETETSYLFNRNGTKARLDKKDINSFKIAMMGNAVRICCKLYYYTLDEMSNEELVQKAKEYLKKKFEEILK